MDKIVRGFKVFGDNTMIYTAPATSADLPRQCVHLGHQDVWLNSATMWQWMADLLQFWTNLSGLRLYGGVFNYPSALAEQLIADINPSMDITQCVTWE